jgi:hypothetical protein
MRDFEKSKDMYEYDYTDITRRGDAIIHKDKQRPLYSRYQPSTLSQEKEEKKEMDPETLEFRNMGLSQYLRLLSEGKIKDNDVGEDELEALKSLTKKYKKKIYYSEPNSDQEDQQNEEDEFARHEE